MINLGIWFLYSIDDNYFLLVTDEKNYILNNFGLIISERIDKDTSDLDIENIIVFSDIPIPPSISKFEIT